jgi:hypothetical protein
MMAWWREPKHVTSFNIVLINSCVERLHIILPYWYTQRDGTHQSSFLFCPPNEAYSYMKLCVVDLGSKIWRRKAPARSLGPPRTWCPLCPLCFCKDVLLMTLALTGITVFMIAFRCQGRWCCLVTMTTNILSQWLRDEAFLRLAIFSIYQWTEFSWRRVNEFFIALFSPYTVITHERCAVVNERYALGF